MRFIACIFYSRRQKALSKYQSLVNNLHSEVFRGGALMSVIFSEIHKKVDAFYGWRGMERQTDV